MNKIIDRSLDEFFHIFGKDITVNEEFKNWLKSPVDEALFMENKKYYGERWKYHSRHTVDIYSLEFTGDIGIFQRIILGFKTINENKDLVSGSDFQLSFGIREDLLDINKSRFSVSLKKPECDCDPILVHCYEGILGENKKLKKLFITLSNAQKNKSTFQLEKFLFDKLLDPARKVEL